MYSKQEASQLRQQFWTTFGQYMRPIPSAGGNKVNWINYKTGVRHITFKMNADERSAYMAIEITHPEPEKRKLFFDQFLFLKDSFDQMRSWIWEAEAAGTGNPLSRIFVELNNVNIYRMEDWPEIISFFKSGIIAIDAWWSEQKDLFEMIG